MALARSSLRSFQVLLLQRGNAALAAWTARSRPSFWVSDTLASSSPVTGSEIFIDLKESILLPFTIFGNPAVKRALFSACSRLGWGIDGGAGFEFIQKVLSPSRYEGRSSCATVLKTSESIWRYSVFAFICCVSIHLEISATQDRSAQPSVPGYCSGG